MIYPKLKEILSKALNIKRERALALDNIITQLNSLKHPRNHLKLNFICTHNSRRSQMAQVWAHVISQHLSLPITVFSGGVEVTAFNKRAIETLMNQGLKITICKSHQKKQTQTQNNIYDVYCGPEDNGLQCFSKLYDDQANPKSEFVAIMTCDHADENCPFIPGALARIPLSYKDPKIYDNTPLEASKYQECSLDISSELYYILTRLKPM